MKKRPEFKDPWEAAKVSSFMDEAEHGRWRIKRFTITDHMALMDHLAAHVEADSREERQMRQSRSIPPGTYLSLQRRATPGEIKDLEDGRVVDGFAPDGDMRFVPIMSDTPTEIREHELAIDGAEGDVLITGLGLGCIVSALLAKPEVTSITVVEIDRDVIALTAPYYEDEPRVEIVNMDALGAAVLFQNEGRWFDFAWHDIWSHIADRNLDDDSLAEHGISYETMFDAWDPICELQEAWAYHEALAMMTVKQLQQERLWTWAEAFCGDDTPDERRRELLVYFHAVGHLPDVNLGDEINPEVLAFVIQHMRVEELTDQQIKARGGLHVIVADIKERLELERNHVPDPMERPNEVPEANVA